MRQVIAGAERGDERRVLRQRGPPRRPPAIRARHAAERSGWRCKLWCIASALALAPSSPRRVAWTRWSSRRFVKTRRQFATSMPAILISALANRRSIKCACTRAQYRSRGFRCTRVGDPHRRALGDAGITLTTPAIPARPAASLRRPTRRFFRAPPKTSRPAAQPGPPGRQPGFPIRARHETQSDNFPGDLGVRSCISGP